MDRAIIIQHIEDSAHHLLLSIHKEGANTKESGIIIKKYIQTGQITPDEEKLLKIQVSDTLKIVGIGIPFVLIPGASILIPILIKVAGKYNIDLLPSVI